MIQITSKKWDFIQDTLDSVSRNTQSSIGLELICLLLLAVLLCLHLIMQCIASQCLAQYNIGLHRPGAVAGNVGYRHSAPVKSD